MPRLNRAQRRYQDKTLKRELTPEQYQDLKSEAIKTMVDLEVETQVKDILEILLVAMRKNRITEERIDKILDDFRNEVRKKVGA